MSKDRTFIELPEAEMSPEALRLWLDSKAAYRMAKEAKTAWEKQVRQDIPAPAGYELSVFISRWGTASFELVPAKATAKSKLTLADYLAQREASGERA